jgi:hypothetical protein
VKREHGVFGLRVFCSIALSAKKCAWFLALFGRFVKNKRQRFSALTEKATDTAFE